MKKFEEELFSEVPCKFGLSTEGEYKQSILVKHFGDWVSPEDHQFKVGEVQDDLSCANEEIERLNAKLEKQQPEIPEVPQFVADWLEYCKEMQVSLYFAVTYFSKVASGKITEGSSSYDDYGYGVSEENSKLVRHWFTSDVHNQEKLALAYINGYTVKEKRFYLKNKLTGQRLIRLLEENGGGFLECVTSTDKERMQFTQSEIDSMETGSYEQIPAEEEV